MAVDEWITVTWAPRGPCALSSQGLEKCSRIQGSREPPWGAALLTFSLEGLSPDKRASVLKQQEGLCRQEAGVSVWVN